MGYIINLTVQAFLFGDDKYDISPDPTGLKSAKWRTKGALGRLWKAYNCGSHISFDTLLKPQRVYKDGQSEVSKFCEQNISQDDEILDEYELYCIIPRLPQKSKQRPIDWWREESKQEAYPNLSRWAVDVLSIPAMSDEPERLFSRAANTLNEDRVQLLPETVQALECIKSWTLQKIGNDSPHAAEQLNEESM
jgi:hypothetical protein